jgi:mono/diheme cytochrome c family protein
MAMIDQRNSQCASMASAGRQTFIGACRERSRALCRSVQCAIAVGAGATVLMTGQSTPDAHTRSTQVTWTADVQPIVAARCVRCHQAGGFGPMALAEYGDAKTWAPAIRAEVLSGRMPPWPGAPGYGDFRNDARLSAIETELIARWADGGAPLGPAVVTRRADVDLDRLDSRRIELPETAVPGSAVPRLTVPITIDRDRWLARWTFEPGDRSIVEEAMLMVNDTIVGSWTPFDDEMVYPSHVADRVPKNAALTVALRLRKTSKPTIDRSALTLAFDRTASRPVRHVVAGCGSYAFDRDADLLAVKPTAAAAGDAIEVVAYGRDEEVTPLAVVSGYRPGYAVTYRMRRPIHLSRGSRVEIRSTSARCSATIDFVDR